MNQTRVLANSPAALSAYVRFGSALAEGTLPRKTRELDVEQFRQECKEDVHRGRRQPGVH